MKTIIRSLGMGGMLAAMIGVAAVSGFGQEAAACAESGANAAQDAIQDKIRNSYVKDKPTALAAGKELLEKYGTCAYSKDFVDWLKPQMTKWEGAIQAGKDAEVRKALFARFDAGIQGKNWDEAYAAGQEIISKYPNDAGLLNQMLPLALIGYYESYNKNYKYNDQSIRFIDTSVSQLKAGKEATKKNKAGVGVYGVFQFEMTKEDALSELSYAKAYITYWAKGDKKAALPLYYESIQMPGKHKDDPYGYASIAGFYADEAGRLGKEYAALVAQRKPDNTPEVAADLEAKIKQTEGMLKGYLDRAIDAYSRAYNFTKNDAANKATRDGLFKTVQDLYKLRYQKDTGVTEFITATVAKPMPNPSTEVTPVIEAETTTTGSAATSAPASTTATTAKPAPNGTTTRPATTTTTTTAPAKPPTKPRK